MANKQLIAREVSKVLKMLGHKEYVTAGKVFFFFDGGNTNMWPVDAVAIEDGVEFTIDRWIAEHKRLKEQA